MSFKAIVIGLAITTCSLAGAQASETHPASTGIAWQEAESSAGAPMALKGTDLLDHAENIQAVDGNPANVIDPSQYDQIRALFPKADCGYAGPERQTLAAEFFLPKRL